MEPKESDLKRFKNSLVKWRERYIKWKNDEIRLILEDTKRTETDIFWDIVKFQDKEVKKLHECLDNYSRSNMILHMAHMIKYKMIGEEDIVEFSEELQEFLTNNKI
jgi:hypothetical protein